MINKKLKKIIFLMLIFHSAFSFYVVLEDGYFAVFPPFAEFWASQMFSDLAISLGLVWLFLFKEAKEKNKPIKPVFICGIGMALLGSISPMLYLLWDKR